MNKHESSPDSLFSPALELLQRLIATPSFSREEDKTADILQEFLHDRGIPTGRKGNNLWACNRLFDHEKPTLLLNSHHDTVKPNQDWTRNPFAPDIENGILYGLGSNDAGGALVSLVQTFVHFYEHELPFNLILAPSAEEEIIGKNGIESILGDLGRINAAIVGEPTNCELAIAEKGLLVLDCTAHGQSGHAARNNGINAISRAMYAIEWLHSHQFPKVSPLLGPVKMTVTLINAGTQHNVIPDRCSFVVDVRTTDAYSQEETLEIIRKQLEILHCSVEARSVRLRPSAISLTHPIVRAAQNLGLPTFASATLSDQSVMPFPSVKIGPGFSERSHTANEYLRLEELKSGIATYIQLIEELATILHQDGMDF